jgi:hypothetical protein
MKSGAWVRLATWALAGAAGCGGETESERDELFSLVSGGSMQRAHTCQAVRDEETSLWAGFAPEQSWEMLRLRVDQAASDEVTRCLDEVRAYNECFLALPCSAFVDRAQPAWLLGTQFAPCGCGVESGPTIGPFVERRGTLPENLRACAEILPIGPLPPEVGFTCE